ncbi:hypothetical protein MA16_Dca027815 [Dendrobium catenatum]|uniref:Uncharacterized protein n=1 Tax=Dendrobium catenatum TaxID=906689 RepID=A0A2I0X1B9_9ASPA|nr:hypothetical protein MA16_Dca027815 [Dendrobium catenatum]
MRSLNRRRINGSKSYLPSLLWAIRFLLPVVPIPLALDCSVYAPCLAVWFLCLGPSVHVFVSVPGCGGSVSWSLKCYLFLSFWLVVSVAEHGC